jgi:hypothetical protein
VREERVHFGHSHLYGVALVVEEHEAADPTDVRFLGPSAEVTPADCQADLFEKLDLGAHWVIRPT